MPEDAIITATRCPYCGRPFSESSPATRDHIFVDALNAHQTIKACKSCNSRIGSEIEGPLLRAKAVLNLLRISALGAGRPIEGALSDDTQVKYDLGKQQLDRRKPVRIDRDSKSLQISGSVDQVRAILRKQGHGPEMVETLISQAHKVSLPAEEMITSSIQYDISLMARLVAKTGLGGGSLVEGDLFINSTLAGSLRDILWGQAKAVHVDGDTVLNLLESTLSVPAVGFNASLRPPDRSSQILYHSYRDGSADVMIVVCHILGFQLFPGLLIAGASPFTNLTPVVVRDDTPSANVRWIPNELAMTIACGIQEFPDV